MLFVEINIIKSIWCSRNSRKPAYVIGYSRKNPNRGRGLREWNFQVIEGGKSRGLIKKDKEFPEVVRNVNVSR